MFVCGFVLYHPSFGWIPHKKPSALLPKVVENLFKCTVRHKSTHMGMITVQAYSLLNSHSLGKLTNMLLGCLVAYLLSSVD